MIISDQKSISIHIVTGDFMPSKSNKSFSRVLKKSAFGFVSMLPMIMGVVGLVGLFQILVTPELLSSVFTGNDLYDTLIGTIAGGVSAGQPIVSYILGGELMEHGISMYAVSAFVLAWVTLGVVQLPMEAEVLGVRFTVIRNILAFVFTIIVAIATVATLKVVG